MNALTGKTIVCVGSTGTFGREFIKTALNSKANLVVALARHEVEMYRLEKDFGQFPQLRCYLADVRDPDRLEMAFNGIDIVIMAAALKRIEQCERDPMEAIKTNIIGSMNVVNACLRSNVGKAILLSTDKAQIPVNLYGATKLSAERLFVAANNYHGKCKFSVSRYGNIWGSRGSVLTIWRQQIAEGKPIRITDPDATRYFMLIEDAVAMVIAQLKTMKGGEIAIPKLSAYRLGDLAEAMGAKKIEVIGLPSWEKKHETMDGLTSSYNARRMTIKELRAAINNHT